MECFNVSSLFAGGPAALPSVELFVSGGEHFLQVLRRITGAGNADDAGTAATESVPIAERTQLDFVEVLQRSFHANNLLLGKFRLYREAGPEMPQKLVQSHV